MMKSQISNKSKFGAVSSVSHESPTNEDHLSPRLRNYQNPKKVLNAEIKPKEIKLSNSFIKEVKKEGEKSQDFSTMNKSGSNKESKFSLVPKTYIEYAAKLDRIKNETMVYLPPL